MKTYRLKINYSEIGQKNLKQAAKIQDFDGSIIEPVDEISPFVLHKIGYTPEFDFNILPKSWLTEIKEPLSFEEFFELENDKNPSRMEYTNPAAKTYGKFTWKAAIENYKLSLGDDQKTLSKLHDEITSFTGPMQEDISLSTGTVEYIWEAALKYARGEK